ncbi:hypothetical protein AN7910.2 [Aspergillus nidulans FGSC A4]|nr:hypothetical protein AN7910.2 [Aspergillus nidulans FGSC A4]|eukprot:XP_681179.1 hypothetical protein AN7910.2 [Aspergillus nidulans FGSC A4]
MATEIAEITNLLKRERYYRDTAQWELCRDAYHPDASMTYIDVSWFQGNIDEFLERSARVHQGRVNVIHSSFDPVDVQVRGRRATSAAFCLITSSITLDGVEYELASYMRLLSRLQKLSDAGPWRILRLEAIYVRDRLVCSFPGRDAAAPLVIPEKALAYPTPYRCMAFVMLHRGLEPRVDLPNEDDQDSVRRVVEGNVAFLSGAEDIVEGTVA